MKYLFFLTFSQLVDTVGKQLFGVSSEVHPRRTQIAYAAHLIGREAARKHSPVARRVCPVQLEQRTVQPPAELGNKIVLHESGDSYVQTVSAPDRAEAGRG